MSTFLHRFATPPLLADEEGGHTARLLHTILWALILSTTTISILLILVSPENTARFLLLTSLIDFPCLVALEMTRRGHTRSSCILLVLQLWTIVTTFAWTGGGIQGPAIVAYLDIVFIAGLLLGGRIGIVAAVVCSLTALGMVIAEMAGGVPPSFIRHTLFSRWLVYVYFIMIIASLQYLAAKLIKDSLHRVRQELAERRQAQEALQASEERFSKAFQSSPVALCFIRLADGSFTDVNDSFLNLFGYSHEEVIGRSIVKLKMVNSLEAGDALERRLREEGVIRNFELTTRNKSGEVLEALFSTEIIELDGEAHALSFIIDITQRERAEAALRQSEAKFSKAFHRGPVGMTISRRADGRWMDVNETFLQMVEFSREEVIGQTSSELNIIGLEERAKLIHQLDEQGYLHNIEIQARAKSGRLFNLLSSSEQVELDGEDYYLTTMVDVTERKQAEKEVLRLNLELEERVNHRTTQLHRQNQYLSALHQITLDLLDHREMETVLNKIATQAATLLNGDHGFVFLADGDLIVLRAATPNFRQHIGEREPQPGTGFLGLLWQTAEPQVIENYATWAGADPDYAAKGIHAMAGVPICIGEVLVGTLEVARTQQDRRTFTAEDVGVLEQLAALASLVLDNVKLYDSALQEIGERKRAEEQIRQHNQLLSSIYDNLVDLLQYQELDELLQAIVDQATQLLDAPYGEIWLLQDDFLTIHAYTPNLAFLTGNRVGRDEARLSWQAVDTQQPAVVDDYATWAYRREIYETSSHHAVAVFPVLSGDRCVGIFDLSRDQADYPFTPDQIQIGNLFARLAALAIDNDHLYANALTELAARQRAEEQLLKANQNLNQEKARLEQFNRQREMMAAMLNLLHASLTTPEASQIVSTYLQLLFPERDGALYLLNGNTLNPIAIWGKQTSLDAAYSVNECWALGNGKPYRFGRSSPNPPCTHVGNDLPPYALCIPLSAQDENLGSLYISTQHVEDVEMADVEEQRFIETIADSVALALANLRLREQLRIQAIRDWLTGLFNRRYLDETLPREIHRAERGKRPLSVLMFDIDNFKKFNDTFGHDAGDTVLKRMAELILSKIRSSDIACRYGGEEFTIILPDTPLDIAHTRAENLREATSQMDIQHNGKDLGKITISMGVAAYPQHGTSRDPLIKAADEASYQAKQAGKNRVIVALVKQDKG